MSKELGDRTQVSLNKALKTAHLVETRINEADDLLKSLIVKLADIEMTVLNSWVFLIVPENMTNALQYINKDDLEASFEKCDPENLDKITVALKNTNI